MQTKIISIALEAAIATLSMSTWSIKKIEGDEVREWADKQSKPTVRLSWKDRLDN